MLFQNRVAWHNEYFKLKEYELQKDFLTILLSGSLMAELPSPFPEERSFIISKNRGAPRNLNKQALLFPTLLHLDHPYLIFP